MSSTKEIYISSIRGLETDKLEVRLAEAVIRIRDCSKYAIMPWEEIKREIEEELDRRSGTGPTKDVAGLIWELRDAQ